MEDIHPSYTTDSQTFKYQKWNYKSSLRNKQMTQALHKRRHVKGQ